MNTHRCRVKPRSFLQHRQVPLNCPAMFRRRFHTFSTRRRHSSPRFVALTNLPRHFRCPTRRLLLPGDVGSKQPQGFWPVPCPITRPDIPLRTCLSCPALRTHAKLGPIRKRRPKRSPDFLSRAIIPSPATAAAVSETSVPVLCKNVDQKDALPACDILRQTGSPSC